MKVLEYVTEDKVASDSMVEAILRAMGFLENEYNYLLHGWRLLVEEQTPENSYFLDVQSDQGGGSFARAKWHTLCEITPNKAASGGDSIDFIRQLIRSDENPEISPIEQQILKLERVDDMTRAQHEYLRDNLGYTNFYGAIRVPFERIVAVPAHTAGGASNLTTVKGKSETVISFSGASQEQDLMLAFMILREMQLERREAQLNLFQYDLKELCKIPYAWLWMSALEIASGFSTARRPALFEL